MKFNSIEFLFFFLIVTTVYFLLNHKSRILWLLVASCVFYMFFVPKYILILFVLIVIDYWSGIWLERAEGNKRKLILLASILSTCLALFIFKYFNFFNSMAADVAAFFNFRYPIGFWDIILPIGLSFHTFQSLSYVIEVYKKRYKAEHDFLTYALYVMYYPQLVAGPIERPQNLLSQFHTYHKFEYDRVVDGLKIMAWGFFKKLVIADRLSIYVDAVYQHPENYSGISLLFATIFFGIQIYCDFSGYSDIAIGAARVMGVKLMTNFKRPYLATSIIEFWRRWHISLSTWFKDYVYIPLGGSRNGKLFWVRNILVVFVISGLWHGADSKFLLWGLLHGILMVATGLIWPQSNETAKEKKWAFWPWLTGVVVTFSFVQLFWIFFRAKSTSDALLIIQKILTFKGPIFFGIDDPTHFGYALLGILFLIAVELRDEFWGQKFNLFLSKNQVVRWAAYIGLVIAILLFGVFDSSQFIYFQF